MSVDTDGFVTIAARTAEMSVTELLEILLYVVNSINNFKSHLISKLNRIYYKISQLKSDTSALCCVQAHFVEFHDVAITLFTV